MLLRDDLARGARQHVGITAEAGGKRLFYVVEIDDDEEGKLRKRVTLFVRPVGDAYATLTAAWPARNERLVRSGLKRILDSLVFVEPHDQDEPRQ